MRGCPKCPRDRQLLAAFVAGEQTALDLLAIGIGQSPRGVIVGEIVPGKLDPRQELRIVEECRLELDFFLRRQVAEQVLSDFFIREDAATHRLAASSLL